jgi:hypothetical protein
MKMLFIKKGGFLFMVVYLLQNLGIRKTDIKKNKNQKTRHVHSAELPSLYI